MAKPPVSTTRRIFVRLLIVLCLGGAGFGAYRLVPQNTVPVRTARATTGTVRDVVSSSVAGEVTPELHALVRAEIAGTVLSVRHKTGDRVQKGEVVIKLDDADLAARLAQAQ